MIFTSLSLSDVVVVAIYEWNAQRPLEMYFTTVLFLDEELPSIEAPQVPTP